MRKTPDQVKEQFVRNGQSIAAWARAYGFKRHVVAYVLNGGRALRGDAHDAAVLLGVKKGTLRQDHKLAA